MKALTLALLTLSLSAFAGEYEGNLCAVVFNTTERYDTAILRIMGGDAIANLNTIAMREGERGDWDNRISRVVVKKGCTFIGYQYQDFGVNYHNGQRIGTSVVLENTGDATNREVFLDAANDNMISSLKCFCI